MGLNIKDSDYGSEQFTELDGLYLDIFWHWLFITCIRSLSLIYWLDISSPPQKKKFKKTKPYHYFLEQIP